jgi:hypothetical protein
MEYIRYYRIICLKRSLAKTKDGYFRWMKPIYWRTGASGYTDDPSMAGIYSAEDVEDCAGVRGDWVLEPLSSSERREANGLLPRTGLEPFIMPHTARQK